MNSKDHIQTFDKESEFESALCEVLIQQGWEPEVLMHPTEEELISFLHEMEEDIMKSEEFATALK